jgi:hypothetical protein
MAMGHSVAAASARPCKTTRLKGRGYEFPSANRTACSSLLLTLLCFLFRLRCPFSFLLPSLRAGLPQDLADPGLKLSAAQVGHQEASYLLGCLQAMFLGTYYPLPQHFELYAISESTELR